MSLIKNQKLEPTWIGKEERPRLEPHEDREKFCRRCLQN